jgi:hypothetical protein
MTSSCCISEINNSDLIASTFLEKSELAETIQNLPAQSSV